MQLFVVVVVVHQQSSLLHFLKNLKGLCFLHCVLCFYVIINPHVILLYVLCHHNSLCVGAPYFMVIWINVLGFFHCAKEVFFCAKMYGSLYLMIGNKDRLHPHLVET
jgi:hypothetical protein